MKFRLGYKAGQLFSGALIHAILKAKADMFSTITKLSAYDYEELHCLLHVQKRQWEFAERDYETFKKYGKKEADQ